MIWPVLAKKELLGLQPQNLNQSSLQHDTSNCSHRLPSLLRSVAPETLPIPSLQFLENLDTFGTKHCTCIYTIERYWQYKLVSVCFSDFFWHLGSLERHLDLNSSLLKSSSIQSRQAASIPKESNWISCSVWLIKTSGGINIPSGDASPWRRKQCSWGSDVVWQWALVRETCIITTIDLIRFIYIV